MCSRKTRPPTLRTFSPPSAWFEKHYPSVLQTLTACGPAAVTLPAQEGLDLKDHRQDQVGTWGSNRQRRWLRSQQSVAENAIRDPSTESSQVMHSYVRRGEKRGSARQKSSFFRFWLLVSCGHGLPWTLEHSRFVCGMCLEWVHSWHALGPHQGVFCKQNVHVAACPAWEEVT